MDSFNKVISFVLGLVVVLVFLAVVTGKLNLKGKSTSTSNITPTPTQKPSSVTINTNTNENNVYSSTPKSIPATGLPTLFIPMLLSGLVGGNFLRKSGKK